MSDDLIIGNEEQAAKEPEVDYIPYEPHDDIAAAYNALAAVEDFDLAIQTEADKRRIRQIKRMSLRIIHYHIKDLYTDIFSEEKEEED